MSRLVTLAAAALVLVGVSAPSAVAAETPAQQRVAAQAVIASTDKDLAAPGTGSEPPHTSWTICWP